MKTYIVGHKCPDTDSVVSAIVLAQIEGGQVARTGEINNETAFVLERFGFREPELIPSENKKVILVDHNSPEEMHENIKKEELIGIVDHHRLGAPQTEGPIDVYVKPYGSTATIISLIAKDHDYALSREEAGILICGVLSDTLKFTSPTTTDKDHEAVDYLNQIAGVTIDELASEMFAAKSDISEVETVDLVNKDYKVFDMGGKKVGIGVCETTNCQTVLDRTEEINEILKDKKKKEELDYILFGVVDIIGGTTQFVIDTDPEATLVADVFGTHVKDGVACLENTVSRKKQIVPKLENYLSQ